MQEITGEKCIRKRVEIGGENFYIVVSDKRVDVTVPHENRDENKELRIIAETLCCQITECLGKINLAQSTQIE